MALTKLKTETLNIPHEPSETITIKSRLSHWELIHARDVKSTNERETVLASIKTIASAPGVIESLMGDQSATTSPGPIADSGDIEDYDELTLFEAAITAWSYKKDDGWPEPVNLDNIRDLDSKTVDWLKAEIAERNLIGADAGKASAVGSVTPSRTAEDGPTS